MMPHRAFALMTLIPLAASLACGRATPLPTPALDDSVATPAETSPSVPPDYQPVFDGLSAILAGWEARLAAMEAAAGETIFGAELLVANGNRGEALLQPSAMAGVRVYLDRLQELGAGGVTVAISDPLLWPTYPQADAYAAFFADVAQEVRGRGMRLYVETGPAFIGTDYSSVRFDWSDLTLEEYWDGRRGQLVRIAREIHPDYMSIGGEPETEMMLTGFSFGVEEHVAFVRETAQAIDRSSGVLVGSGSGSWEDPDFTRLLAEEPGLDFIGIHIYPLTNGTTDYLERAADMAETARAAGKRVLVGETSLYKVTPDELRRGMGYADIYARDAYSFWQPLDVRYVQLIGGLARVWGVEYASFFWSGFFFGYLEYEESLSPLPLPELTQQLNRVQAANIEAGVFSDTGRAFQELVDSSVR
jgi:hypothetical protein